MLATSLEVWANLDTVVLTEGLCTSCISITQASPEACQKCRISASPYPLNQPCILVRSPGLFTTLQFDKYFLMLLDVVSSQSLNQPLLAQETQYSTPVWLTNVMSSTLERGWFRVKSWSLTRQNSQQRALGGEMGDNSHAEIVLNVTALRNKNFSSLTSYQPTQKKNKKKIGGETLKLPSSLLKHPSYPQPCSSNKGSRKEMHDEEWISLEAF